MTADFHALHAEATWGLFARQLLLELNVPGSDKNMAAMLTWMAAEGTKARYNPLATTRVMPGATAFNSSFVRNYPTLAVGIMATTLTMEKPTYDAIRSRLKAGTGLRAIGKAVVASPWGTQTWPWAEVWADMPAYSKRLVSQ